MKTPLLPHLISTGFDTLDEMLGGGIPPGNVVLLRGGPSSGKTTFALHMIASALGRDLGPDAPKEALRSNALYLSLELDPEAALKHAETFEPCYKLRKYHKESRLLLITQDDICKGWADVRSGLQRPATRHHAPKKRTKPHTVAANWLETLLVEVLGRLASDKNLEFSERTVIVVDSLNIFADLLTLLELESHPKLNLRGAMRAISNAVRRWGSERCVTLVLGEHHPGYGPQHEIESESFLCDVEILLTPETVAGENRTPLDCINPLGYVMERRFPDKVREEVRGVPQAVEVRAFCRILKSRNTRAQARRCTYGIVPTEGIKFYPTYPGDGSVLLFGENAPQNVFWDEFLFNEVPYTYPALRYERFGRKGLQRIFGTQRQLRYIPDQTDMYLASFDSYWIKWYAELGERSLLAELAHRELGSLIQHLSTHAFAELLCRITREVRAACMTSSSVSRVKEHHLCACVAVLTTRVSRILDWGLNNHIAQEDAGKKIEEGMMSPDRSILSQEPRESRALHLWLRKQIWSALKTLSSTAHDLTNARDIKASRIASSLLWGKDNDHALFASKGDFEKKLTALMNTASRRLCSEDGVSGVLKPIPEQSVRLYGERLSELIEHIDRRPEAWKGKKHLSIPYHANISFLVYRADLLQSCSASLAEVEKLYKLEVDALKRFQERFTIPEDERVVCPPFKTIKAQLQIQPKEDATNPAPTWEQLAVLCMDKGLFLIETLTFDTFLCAFLEMFWSFGGQLIVDEEYTITKEYHVKQTLFQTFFLLRYMFAEGIIPTNATLDPKTFGRQHSQPSGMPASQGKQPGKQWLFARHWYSTFVEVLTAKQVTEPYDWLWNPPQNTKLEIMPIPLSIQQLALAQTEKPATHHSCWGDWHLGVLRNTENLDLAVEILNNLMSSHKICESAVRCASIPAVEQFYKSYSPAKCFNIPEREEKIVLPAITFDGLRQRFMKDAKSRSDQMFDYRHCMRELHSVLSAVHFDPKITEEALAEMVIDAIERIRGLRYQTLMLH